MISNWGFKLKKFLISIFNWSLKLFGLWCAMSFIGILFPSISDWDFLLTMWDYEVRTFTYGEIFCNPEPNFILVIPEIKRRFEK